MKSRRFKKSRTAARKCNGSKKRGGMWRSAAKTAFKTTLDGIIGKKGTDKLDKAQQVADAILKGLATKSQGTPVTPGTARTFSTPTINRLRIADFDDFDRNITSPIENPIQNLYKTPVKRKGSNGSNDSNDSNGLLPKVRRHHSRISRSETSYAPTIRDPRMVVTGNLFQELTD